MDKETSATLELPDDGRGTILAVIPLDNGTTRFMISWEGAQAASADLTEAQTDLLLGRLGIGRTLPANTSIPMRLICPSCFELHVDEGEFATKPHHTHACQACGNVWRPAIAATVGVRFLPGFKNS